MAQDAATISTSWAESFLAKGWTAHRHFTLGLGGRRDWVIVELVAREQTGAVTYRILHAPEFLFFADDETLAAILKAVRGYPAQVASRFEWSEKPFYVAQRLSGTLVAELTPKLAPLPATSFKWPILVMSRDPVSGSLMLLGSPITFNVGFTRFLNRDGSEIDEGTALMILMTCRAREKRPSPTRGLKLTLTQPFHPRRLAQIVAKTKGDGAGLSAGEQRSSLLHVMHRHVPHAVESLRTNPPVRSANIISVLRSRLAESVSDELLGRTPRVRIQNPRSRWESALADLTATQRAHLTQILSRAEREEVGALVARRRSSRHPSTRRVLLSRAHAKLAKVLRNEAAAKP